MLKLNVINYSIRQKVSTVVLFIVYNHKSHVTELK